MKVTRFFTLLFTACLLISMPSCSDDSDPDENLVYIAGINIVITDVLITSGDEVLVDKSELNTSSLLMGFEKHKDLNVKATAKVFYNTIGTDEKEVYFVIAKSNGDNVKTLEEFEKNDVPDGEEITLSTTVTF